MTTKITSLVSHISELTGNQLREMLVDVIEEDSSSIYFNVKGPSAIEQIRIALGKSSSAVRLRFENHLANEIECRLIDNPIQNVELVRLYDLAAKLKSLTCAAIVSRQLLSAVRGEATLQLEFLFEKSLRSLFTLSRLDTSFVIVYESLLDSDSFRECKVAAFWSLCFCQPNNINIYFDKYLQKCLSLGMIFDDLLQFLVDFDIHVGLFSNIGSNVNSQTETVIASEIKDSVSCVIEMVGNREIAPASFSFRGDRIETDLFQFEAANFRSGLIGGNVLDMVPRMRRS